MRLPKVRNNVWTFHGKGMNSYEVTQRNVRMETTYEVRREEGEDLVSLLVGTEAILRLHESDRESPVIASLRMKSILTETNFELYDENEETIGAFEFPMFEFTKRCQLKLGSSVYAGEGGVRGRTFRFRNGEGELVLEIAKRRRLRDAYKVRISEEFPRNIGLLATGLIDQKYFEGRG